MHMPHSSDYALRTVLMHALLSAHIATSKVQEGRDLWGGLSSEGINQRQKQNT
jgi:hypothetical protein